MKLAMGSENHKIYGRFTMTDGISAADLAALIRPPDPKVILQQEIDARNVKAFETNFDILFENVIKQSEKI